MSHIDSSLEALGAAPHTRVHRELQSFSAEPEVTT